MTDARQLWPRLILLGLGTVIVQVAAISQLRVFDTNADLTPLVVAAAALLCGSLPGAAFGFGVGLFLDLALVQTVGMSSLLYLTIGYGAGRLRELRDPQAAVVPIVVGAAATALSQIGFSLMQFLLGEPVPLDPALARQIVLPVLLGGLIALPVYAIVRRWLLPALPEDPRAPPAPRLHDRRALAPFARMSSFPGLDSRRPPLTPQLALRVALVGGFAFALFAIVFLRLWYLQVLTGDDLRREALDNRVRKVALAAPRGAIVDRNGQEIVTNRVATVVQLDPRRIPAEHRDAALDWGQAMSKREARPEGSKGPSVPVPQPPEVLRRRFAELGGVLGMSARSINERVVQQLAVTPYANIRVRVDVPQTMRNFLLERRADFPGVTVQQVYLRRYQEGSTAAQLVGTIGEINPDELGTERYRGVVQGTVVGKEGIERTYDSYLRGDPGVQSITIDAAGRPKSQRVARDPRPGDQLKTSLDLDLQQAGQRALARMVQGGKGTAGAFVALDPRNGEVLATASYPTFRPSLLSRPISQQRYDSIFGSENGSPKFNRAISGGYPTGSTFKPITALAALDRGLITPDTPINDSGSLKVGTQVFRNARNAVHGTISLRRALQVSSDVFFYTLGRDANGLKGQAIQSWARRLGLGHTTGIDLPNEFGGTIPDRAWRARLTKKEEACERRTGRKSCGISDKRPWSLGDNINLAVGQGDVQATPLQMAVAYAAIGNGGKVVRPHVGVAVEDDGGRELQRIRVPAPKRLKIDEANRQAVLDGLRLSTVGDGTSAGVFSDWKHDAFPIYGKTGTAERPPRPEDQSWYVAYAPHRGNPIVIAATVEQGGFGAEAAAPIVCRMLAQWYHQKASCTAAQVKE